MAQLETNSESRTKHLKTYESPKIKEHFVVETESLLKSGSIEKTVDKNGLKEEWIEEDVPETFSWEW